MKRGTRVTVDGRLGTVTLPPARGSGLQLVEFDDNERGWGWVAIDPARCVKVTGQPQPQGEEVQDG